MFSVHGARMNRDNESCQPFEWARADPDDLEKFDPDTKICTMNCGPHQDDPRSREERKFLCDDCVTVQAGESSRSAA